MSLWPWLAVEVSKVVVVIYSLCGVILLANVLTSVIFSCTGSKKVKKMPSCDKLTGSISCRPIKSLKHDDTSVSMKDNKPPTGTTTASTTKQLPTPCVASIDGSKKGEKLKPELPGGKKDKDGTGSAQVPKAKDVAQPSSVLKADQERSMNNNISSKSKRGGTTSEAVQKDDAKVEKTQSEASGTQSDEKSKKCMGKSKVAKVKEDPGVLALSG